MTPWDNFVEYCHRVGVSRVSPDVWCRYSCPTPECANHKDKAAWCRFDTVENYWAAGCHRCRADTKQLRARMGLERPQSQTDDRRAEEMERLIAERKANTKAETANKRAVAGEWVRNSVPVSADNDGGKYLISRGINLETLQDNVLWLPKKHDTWNTMTALSGYSGVLLWLLCDAPTSNGYIYKWDSIQREAIAAGGVRLDKAGGTRHRRNWISSKGKVFVAERGPIVSQLGVAEGQIDALKVAQKLDFPCVASCSMSAMSNLTLDPRLSLYIFPDPEEQALDYARQLKQKHISQGGNATIITTTTDPGDWK